MENRRGTNQQLRAAGSPSVHRPVAPRVVGRQAPCGICWQQVASEAELWAEAEDSRGQTEGETAQEETEEAADAHI